MMIDPDARYLKSHEWAKIYDGNIFSVGLSAYAVAQLGEIIYVKLPRTGAELNKGESFGVVESLKSTVEISMPISGTIVEINTRIPDNPGVLCKDPYGDAWLIRVKGADSTDWDLLLDASAYKQFLQMEG